jgi:hypothetical protein
MAQEVTKNSEQEIMNQSFDPTFNVQLVEGLGYDSVNLVLRPLAVDDQGQLKVVA